MKKVFISTLVMLTSMNLMAQDLAKYPWLDTSKSSDLVPAFVR